MISKRRAGGTLLLVAASIICVLLLSACTVEQPQLPVWQGAYRWGHEVNSFCPCGSDKCYWVRTSDQLQQQLRSYVQQHTSKPYQPVYLLMRGQLLDQPGEGFARDYDALISIDALIALGSGLPRDCQQP